MSIKDYIFTAVMVVASTIFLSAPYLFMFATANCTLSELFSFILSNFGIFLVGGLLSCVSEEMAQRRNRRYAAFRDSREAGA